MIGLGAKYLTAAGFGRYRITAASLGNLDLLGTLGGWLTKATKQAILGAFGDDGMAVIRATNAYLDGIAASDRDKATALAALINEDPMMVCSLGLQVPGVTMPIRWLVGDGTAWIRTGLKLSTDAGIRIKANLSTIASVSARLCGNSGDGYYFQVGVDSGRLSDLKVQVGGSATEQFFALPSNKVIDLVVEGTPATARNFDTVWTTTLTRRNPAIQMDDMSIFSNSTNGTNIIKAKIALFDIWSPTAGTTKSNPSARYVPFIRSGQVECLDLITESIAERHGTFSIVYTEADGVTPWTPSTP